MKIFLLIALAVVSPLTLAQDVLETARDFDISAGPLDSALVEFGRQANVEISADGEVLRPYRTTGVRGRESIGAALSKLLSNSGLTFRLVGNTVQVRPAETQGSGVSRAESSQRLAAASPRETRRADAVPAASETFLEEVIVSAQKRQERLVDVPISISVLGGEAMDRSTAEGVSEALNKVPGVATTVAFFGGTNLMVRGVTASSPTFAGSSPVAYYLDSVPFGLVNTAIVPDASAYDVDRVEVLRGPQGTLYGASAQNGVVRVLTKEANLSDFEFKARGSVSSTDKGGENYRGDVAVNVPMVEDKLAARLVVGHQNLSGWIDRPNEKEANDAKIDNVRLKVHAQASDDFSIGVSAWRSRSDYGAASNGRDDGTHSATLSEPVAIDYDVYGLRLGYDAPSFTLVSTTGYMEYMNANTQDFGPFVGVPLPLYTIIDADTLSQELILSSLPGSAWHWSVGAFYRDGEDRLRQNSLAGGAPFDYTNGSESYAVFGEFGRRFYDDRLEWTLGVRYFRDDVFVRENVSQGPPGSALLNNKDSFDATTPRVVLTWHARTDLNVYGSYSQGFRSGFSQSPGVLRSFPTFPAAEPDKLHNYEMGMKARVLDGRLTLDTAVYYIDWEEVQQLLVVPAVGSIVAAVVNGTGASGAGFDFALSVTPVNGLTLGLSVGWNDLKMDADVYSLGVLVFEKGDRLNLSPETTVGASIDYAFGLPWDNYEARLSASANYVSEQSSTNMLIGVRTFGEGDPLTIGRVSASLDAPSNWSATLFVDNVNNEDGAVARNVILPVPDWSPRVRPRTIGLQLEYRF